MPLTWKFKKVTQLKVNIKLSWNSDENITHCKVTTQGLQHDAGKFWGIIFTRRCNIIERAAISPWFQHDLVPKATLNTTIKLHLDTLYRQFMKSYLQGSARSGNTSNLRGWGVKNYTSTWRSISLFLTTFLFMYLLVKKHILDPIYSHLIQMTRSDIVLLLWLQEWWKLFLRKYAYTDTAPSKMLPKFELEFPRYE